MKLQILAFLLLIAAGCNPSKKMSTPAYTLNGTWVPTKQEMSGNELPAMVYQTQKLVIAYTTYTLIAESTDKGILHYQNGQMDIYGKDGVNAGKHFTAIYKLENDLLTICYNLMGTSYPTSYDSKAGPALFLSVFKRQ
ncbi:MAG: TIGR03067 domain-containing protein [Bacteroidetes bacterium]|nr:TIGR03067 domain-containing protein [Bacteroidota bacterium]